MSTWEDKTPAQILSDINAMITEVYAQPPTEMWIPFDTFWMLKRWLVKRWLQTRKLNKRRPAFATAFDRKRKR
jgi:hypothetical protein